MILKRQFRVVKRAWKVLKNFLKTYQAGFFISELENEVMISKQLLLENQKELEESKEKLARLKRNEFRSARKD